MKIESMRIAIRRNNWSKPCNSTFEDMNSSLRWDLRSRAWIIGNQPIRHPYLLLEFWLIIQWNERQDQFILLLLLYWFTCFSDRNESWTISSWWNNRKISNSQLVGFGEVPFYFPWSTVPGQSISVVPSSKLLRITVLIWWLEYGMMISLASNNLFNGILACPAIVFFSVGIEIGFSIQSVLLIRWPGYNQ